MGIPTSDLDYELPSAAIAQTACEPRDASRLLVTSSMTDRVFADLPEILEEGDLVVVNTTKVRRARIATTRADTGGSVEVLLLGPLGDGRWEAMVRPARRLRTGVELIADSEATMTLRIAADPVEGVAIIQPDGDLEALAQDAGTLPLPPYFHGRLEDEDRYQTVFADRVGSAAAPTAALHFTDGVIAGLAARGIELAEVELEVGLDTFRPVGVDDLADHEIHTETYRVPEKTVAAIAATHDRGGRVVAVGTTVVRTLESAASSGEVVAGPGVADLFITPGYRLQVVDAMLTNFHAPRTTLIALVATLLGPAWRDAYQAALDRGYRFLSFGDAMLIDHVVDEAKRR